MTKELPSASPAQADKLSQAERIAKAKEAAARAKALRDKKQQAAQEQNQNQNQEPKSSNADSLSAKAADTAKETDIAQKTKATAPSTVQADLSNPHEVTVVSDTAKSDTEKVSAPQTAAAAQDKALQAQKVKEKLALARAQLAAAKAKKNQQSSDKQGVIDSSQQNKSAPYDSDKVNAGEMNASEVSSAQNNNAANSLAQNTEEQKNTNAQVNADSSAQTNLDLAANSPESKQGKQKDQTSAGLAKTKVKSIKPVETVSSLDDLEIIEGRKEQAYTKAHQPSLWEIFIKGIWKDNPGLCQLLGMCPLLAVTSSAANALGLGMATIIVMVLSSMVISLLRRLIMPEVRIPLYVMLIATLVTVVRIEIEAYFPSLYQQLGIYLSLIVTNCVIMARAEAFAGKNNLLRSTVDAIACSIGFTLVLFALGCVREVIGNGTLFMGAADVLGEWARGLETQVMAADQTLLIAILPPGGFFVLAMFIAFKNFLDGHAKRRAERRFRIRSMNI